MGCRKAYGEFLQHTSAIWSPYWVVWFAVSGLVNLLLGSWRSALYMVMLAGLMLVPVGIGVKENRYLSAM